MNSVSSDGIVHAMQPLATFRCSRWLWTETFSLSAEQVAIQAALRLSKFAQRTHRFPLRCLVPMPTRHCSRPAGFIFGLCGFLGGLCIATAWIASRGLEVPGDGPVFPVIMAVFGLVGLGWALDSVRRWRYVRFYSEGGALVFTVACSPNDVIAFELFVDAMVQQIRSVNRAA